MTCGIFQLILLGYCRRRGVKSLRGRSCKAAPFPRAMGTAIDSLPPGKRIVEKQSDVAVELTVRVLRVLNMYGIPASATANPDVESYSVAVKVLKDIGDAVGLHNKLVTWRGIIIKAKKASPGLT